MPVHRRPHRKTNARKIIFLEGEIPRFQNAARMRKPASQTQ